MAMDFSPAEKELLREKLLTALEPYTMADPSTLVEFIFMFLNKNSERDELRNTYKEELSVFCEDNTDKAVDVLFGVFDQIMGARKQEVVAGRKREKDESDDEDDDDRNFKRRNTEDVVADIPPMNAPSPPKRADDDRPARLGREEDGPRFSHLPEHLRKRLGGRTDGPREPQQKPRQPCRFFEERGYCLYGDNCKFDHGQDHIAVSDYSNFQAMFPGSSLPMANPMMMGMTAPYNMTAQPYGFQNNMGNQQPNLTQQPQWQQSQQPPRHHQQAQRPNTSQNDVPYTTRYTKDSTRIVIEKIPLESCNIDAVTETFKKFGTIVDIELQPENQRAFLEFKTHDEAHKAHQSPEVLFNNRFVKVYWRKEERQPYKPPTPDPELVKKRMEELQKIREETQRRKKEQLEKQIEYNKQKQEIARRNLELAMLKAKVAKMEEAKKKSTAAAEESSGSK
ncbi:hypothetical protein BJV82DRAFT_605275 [Fennellomyces sp. T-0311]|nr:hypothetical protein BJV82DRAFT_605275 [Fennellomyces sp. T-0311]